MQHPVDLFQEEVKKGIRFRFGKNWRSFLHSLAAERIKIAEKSILDFYQVNDLKGKTFLDIGCGSGLFSLAACNLGAEVYSIDFDPDSVWCVSYLKEKYYPEATWQIKEGSILDANFINSIGKFDYVYSWGVLHHTGNMKLALENVVKPLDVGGKLFIGIYNDQGAISKIWRKIKELYNWNFLSKFFVSAFFIFYWSVKFVISSIVRLQNPYVRYQNYKRSRGMSLYHDWIDWLGGLPFEVATPEYIVDFYSKFHLQLTKISTTNSLGINQFVFIRE
jgi:2-polyprenyl-3-methyl-5-hydroxy-6-metoxy-1,4-benzoquinol methylase